jgi:hypothetical protein
MAADEMSRSSTDSARSGSFEPTLAGVLAARLELAFLGFLGFGGFKALTTRDGQSVRT